MVLRVICDLRKKLGPVRDQGRRPTCLAFAASDTHAAMRPNWTPLSCEYIYYHAIKRDLSHPSRGATLPAMLEALREDGQPSENEWSYLNSVPAKISSWKPPLISKPLFRRDSDRNHATVKQLIDRLDDGIPLIVTMCLSNAFYCPDKDGLIDSNETPDHAIRHAVVAVGYGKKGNETFILIRNSWGTTWGVFGYAWVSKKYMKPRLIDFAELTKDLTNVHGSRAA